MTSSSTTSVKYVFLHSASYGKVLFVKIVASSVVEAR